MNDVVRLNGVSVDVEEARKAVAEFDAKKTDAEKLYDGLTIEQWQYVIDGKFLCELWDNGDNPAGDALRMLESISQHDLYFSFRTGNCIGWKHCRPAQVYGVRHPCFGKRPEWLKDSDLLVHRVYLPNTQNAVSQIDVCSATWSQIIEFIAMPAGGKIE